MSDTPVNVPGKFSFKRVSAAPAASGPAATQPPIDVKASPVVESAPTAVASPAPTQSAAPISPAAGAVVEYRPPATYGDDSDNVGVEDINLPRINIVQKVGDLSNIFSEGDVVLNKETVIYKSPKTNQGGKPLNLVVVGFRPDRYVEKTEGGARGDIVDTEAEVFKKNGTLDFNEAKATGKKLYQTLAECLVLIEKPEGVEDPAFSYVADGKPYAIAIWAQKGTAYTNGAKIIRTARKAGWLKDGPDGVKRGYFFGRFEFSTFLKQYTTNFAWIPILKRPAANSDTSAEVRALAQSILG